MIFSDECAPNPSQSYSVLTFSQFNGLTLQTGVYGCFHSFLVSRKERKSDHMTMIGLKRLSRKQLRERERERKKKRKLELFSSVIGSEETIILASRKIIAVLALLLSR